jgi:hypothetical protein
MPTRHLRAQLACSRSLPLRLAPLKPIAQTKDRLVNAAVSWTLRLSPVVIAACLGACTTQPGFVCRVPMAPMPVAGSSQQSEAVFDAPDQAMFLSSIGDVSLPEETRLDGALGVGRGEFAALEATRQWPSAPQPDITQLRVIYLPVRTSSSFIEIPVFGDSPAYGHRRPYHHHNYWHRGPRSVHPQQY